MPFSSSDRPRNIPILDSGVGGHLDCGYGCCGGVDGGVGNVLGALCMAKRKPKFNSCGWNGSPVDLDRTERNLLWK
jgi:hypothetical protein